MRNVTAPVWRWLTGRITVRPRRLTAVFWLLYVFFLPQQDALYDRYRAPVRRVDLWLLLALALAGLILLGYGWFRGRGARRRRRECETGNPR